MSEKKVTYSVFTKPWKMPVGELGRFIAGPTDERIMAACAEACIPVIRICVGIGEEGYLASEANL
ncbi:MAG: hypothetical protein IT210_13915 [Armatimonadetes bacterium]|nr:hypothetical protein [Armatimonadota bacterium]